MLMFACTYIHVVMCIIDISHIHGTNIRTSKSSSSRTTLGTRRTTSYIYHIWLNIRGRKLSL